MGFAQSLSVLQRTEGYDRTSTLFSPEGRLLQIDYAEQAVRHSPTNVLAFLCNESIGILRKEHVDSFSRKDDQTFLLDDHIILEGIGIKADVLVLKRFCTQIALQHRAKYGIPILIRELTSELSDLLHSYTIRSGTRPLGVSFVIGGYDCAGSHLYTISPSGNFEEKYAEVLGSHASAILENFRKTFDYNKNLAYNVEVAAESIITAFDMKKEQARELSGATLDTQKCYKPLSFEGAYQ